MLVLYWFAFIGGIGSFVWSFLAIRKGDSDKANRVGPLTAMLGGVVALFGAYHLLDSYMLIPWLRGYHIVVLLLLQLAISKMLSRKKKNRRRSTSNL
jgi:hypothetical protein